MNTRFASRALAVLALMVPLLFSACAGAAGALAGAALNASPLGGVVQGAKAVSAVTETTKIMGLDSPVKGTYEVTYALGEDSRTVFVRTHNRPLVPSSLDESHPLRMRAEGYLMTGVAALRLEDLQAGAFTTQEDAAKTVGGTFLFIFDRQYDQGTTDRTFEGMIVGFPPEGVDPVLDRIRTALDLSDNAGPGSDQMGTFTMTSAGDITLSAALPREEGTVKVTARRISKDHYPR